MLAPTHSIFGIFLTLIILAVFGIQWSLHWSIMVTSVLGAIVPDIDHPRSSIGKLFPFISNSLEQKYGHRTITHSLIGWMIFTSCFAIIILFMIWIFGFVLKFSAGGGSAFGGDVGGLDLLPRWVAAFSISYFSHLVLDMFNPRGIQMFWPDTGRDVIPKNPKLRPASGSKAEIPIFFICFALMVLALPVFKYGLSSSLRWLLATPGSAIEEFKAMKTHTYLEFKGIMAETRTAAAGKAELLDVCNQRLVILYQGKVYTLSDELAADILASHVRTKKTELPIKIERKELKNQSREALLSRIPKGALISGVVHLPTGLEIKIDGSLSPGTFKTIEQKGSALLLTYASRNQLLKLTAAKSFDLQNKKARIELLGLNARANKLRRLINEIQDTDDLTPLGKKVLMDQKNHYRQTVQLSELQSQLEEVNIKIEELKSKINEQKLLFSGEVYIRQ